MKELELYREDNGQYSTSEARQDDVSGSYVQKTDYDELRAEHYDRRAKLQDLEKENAELKLALGIALSFPVKVRMECRSRIETKLVSLEFITTLYDSANRAINESAAQHLADIQANAVLDVANNWIIRKDADYNTRRKIVAISNKLRGESK